MLKNVWKGIFIIYLLMLLIFIVFKFDGSIQMVINTIEMNMYRRELGGLTANLIPFRTIEAYIGDINQGISFVNILGNIIPFIPMGFIIPMAFPSQRNIIKTMFYCLLIIISIEVLQLILFLGIFDIDDIIMNQLSCIIGFMLFITYKKFY